MKAVEAVLNALEDAAGEIREMGCTCATGAGPDEIEREHGRTRDISCAGHSRALDYERIAKKARRSLGLARRRSNG